jgi:hypothetical protein
MTTKKTRSSEKHTHPPVQKKMEEPGALDPGLPSERPFDPSSDTGPRSPKGQGAARYQRS